jgi:transposase-like protein
MAEILQPETRKTTYGAVFVHEHTLCPRCGSANTEVYRTMPPPTAEQLYRFRYHRCHACHKNFRSHEPCALEARS